MGASVESVCNSLARSRLLSPERVRDLYRNWRTGSRDPTSLTQFSRWLVANRYVTEYQMGLLLLGKSEHFFLGEYQILERIGKGRMAGVYKAVHALGQVVAIKVLPPSRARDPESFARLRREDRLALRLQHPNVVRTFDVGEADGLNYLVMEYLEGETLDEVLQRRGRLPPAEAAGLVYQALLGLQHVHEQGMVHRDLKPGNLMLVAGPAPAPGSDPVRPHVKLLDIGLGRALFDEAPSGSPDQIELTNQGSLLGTPEYTAPEQTRDAHRADIRADIYSLGCVLYHLVAGRPPFEDVNVVRQIVRHATETPRPLRSFKGEVPDAFEEIIHGMMAKDPAQRYPTPNHAARALRVFVESESLNPRPAASDPVLPSDAHWVEARRDDPHAADPPPTGEDPPPGDVIPVPVAAGVDAGRAAANGSPAQPDGQPEVKPAEPFPSVSAGLHRLELPAHPAGFWVAVGISATVAAGALGWWLAEWLSR